MDDSTATFRQTTSAVAAILQPAPDPRAETPCPEWNYAQLLAHLVNGDRLFLDIVTGGAEPPTAPRCGPDADQPLPTADDYREASSRLATLLEQPDVQTSVYSAPVGRLRGTQVAHLRAIEHLLHGWDLAVAGGMRTSGLEPAAAALAETARELLDTVGDKVLAERRPFGPSVDVAEDASALERLVAAFGRDPGWQPTLRRATAT